MSRRPKEALWLLALALLAATALAAAGCGSKDELMVSEGEPVTLGPLTYNVQLSRFLNSGDTEDQFYLQGRKPLPPGKGYFGVFIQVKNNSGAEQPIPQSFEITDTQNRHYTSEKPKGDFSLALGGKLDGNTSAPGAETPAQSGPTQGAMILFVVDSDVTENRPLHMSIPSPDGGEPATVKLDI